MNRSLLVLAALLAASASAALAQERARITPSTVQAATPDEGPQRVLLDQLGVQRMPEPTHWTFLGIRRPSSGYLRVDPTPPPTLMEIQYHPGRSLPLTWSTNSPGVEKVMWQIVGLPPCRDDIAPSGLVQWDVVPAPGGPDGFTKMESGAFDLPLDRMHENLQGTAWWVYYVRVVPFGEGWNAVGPPSNPVTIVLRAE